MNFSIEKAKDWSDVGFNLQKKAFSIPKIDDLEISKNIFELLLKNHNSGSTFRNFKKELLNLYDENEISIILSNSGNFKREFKDYNQVDSTLKCSFHIFSRLLHDYNRFIQKNKVRERRSIWRFDAVNDSNSFQLENTLNNRCFHYTDSIWDYFMPPNSPFDRMGFRSLSDRQVERKDLKVEKSKNKITIEDVDFGDEKKETTGFKNLENTIVYAYPGWNVNFFNIWS